MPDFSCVPRFRKPVRLPDNVDVCLAEPSHIIAGEKVDLSLPFLVSRAIGPEERLKLQISGGRNNRRGFENLHETDPDRPGFIELLGPEGSLPLSKCAEPDIYDVQMPSFGLPEETSLRLQLNEAVPTPIRLLDKFVVLYVAHGDDDHPPWWNRYSREQIVGACLVHILGGEPKRLRAYAPSQVEPGETFGILVRPEDRFTNLASQPLPYLEVSDGARLIPSETFLVPESTCTLIRVALPETGIFRLHVFATNERLQTTTNPIVCRPSQPGQLAFRWGVLHFHSEFSDGIGSLDYCFSQMRDEAALDFAASSDHDHAAELDEELWQLLAALVEHVNEPGRFVSLLGYEWGKWRRDGSGDRCVYFRHDHRPIHRSDDDDCPTADSLFQALADEEALIVPHHSGHGAHWCDWAHHEPEKERLVEIYQVRGSYERTDDNPLPERSQLPSQAVGYVVEALNLGWRVGFTGGGDDHEQHAGTEYVYAGLHDRSYKAGLTAVLTDDLTRDALWHGLWARRTVATSGPRIILWYTLNDELFGSELNAVSMPEILTRRRLRIWVSGTAPIAGVDIVRGGHIVRRFIDDELDQVLEWVDETPLDRVLLPAKTFCNQPFTYYYVRVRQIDGEMAWASPVWLQESD